ncbi:hypothetical protein G647_02512 [Cladophialophora carrionii CBS 160.54]|uniref:Uncharacterized protein n=1 Tax=Cladophialophora carrionii CBS 160.54 TaxID=1279043 RepID=V9DHD1_9EURO|nr:uncharacterized protein G647_02512 [Cladophialophora carrionii CBS 160.54]ETI25738.1 hypothetical protein G647_02512 [Cladophialophora carrionii CBS 160.54]
MKQHTAAYDAMTSKLETSEHIVLRAATTGMNQSILHGYFMNGSSVVQLPFLQKVSLQNGLMGGDGVPQISVCVYNAVDDIYSYANDTARLVAKCRKAGTTVRCERNMGSESFRRGNKWRCEGVELASSCAGRVARVVPGVRDSKRGGYYPFPCSIYASIVHERE